MSNEEYVVKLYNRGSELIRICNYHGIFRYDADDIISELYIKMLKFNNIDKYVRDDEPNMYIVFAILRNLIFDYRKKEKRYSDEDVMLINIIDDNEIVNEKYDFVINEIENIDYWFDRNIIDIYINYNHTIRSLAKATKIPFSTIQPIIHRFKLNCKSKYKK